MVLSTTFLVLAVVAILIWVFMEIKRFKHKLLAIFLIGLILFAYFSFTTVITNNNMDLKSIPGVISAGKVYFSWFLSVGKNFKTITTNVIHLDWKGNETVK